MRSTAVPSAWSMRSPSTGREVGRPHTHLSVVPSGPPPPDPVPVGGLRMSQADPPPYEHRPVMAAEVVELFSTVPAGTVLDGTVGGGGQAEALLRSRPDLTVLGSDRDPVAVRASRRRLQAFGLRAQVVHATFEQLVADVGTGRLPADRSGPVVGVLLDLGVSSVQLDQADRGFSYRRSGPLDMRMDQEAESRTAADLVNEAPEAELVRLLAASGEGRLARRLARAIVAARPLRTTDELARVVADAVPAPGRRRGHPARRVFQALRIAVNDELGQLAESLPALLDFLAVGGRAVVLAYHSGEDALVKRLIAEAVRGDCRCPPGLPCICGAVARYRLVFRGARRPRAAEVAENHRAESARLRAVERVAGPGDAGGGPGARSSGGRR